MKVIAVRRRFWAAAIVVEVMLGSCAAPAATLMTQFSPTIPATLGVKATVDSTTSQPSGANKLPMDEIFPPGNGREAALNNCIQCHSIIRIVWGPRTEGEWTNVKHRHMERVRGLDDESFNAIFIYLRESFSPDKPYPRLPQWYLDSVAR